MAKQRYQDLGFGEKAAEADLRLLNRDGSFNVRRRGLPFFESFSFYHALLTMSWVKFYMVVVLAYLVVNALFALVYLAIGIEGFAVVDGHTLLAHYLEAFFFSTQTFTTVGYGRVSPVSIAANAVAAFESMTGLLTFALATGVLYGRFSRPYAKLMFSRNAVVAPYGEGNSGFMFRIANKRRNQLIDVEAKLVVVKFEDIAGKRVRKFYELELEREKLSLFHLSWTVVHPIEPSSPLFGMTKAELDRSDAEFLILIKAFDDTFSQTVHTRSSYKASEVLYERKFATIILPGSDGITELDLGRMDDTIPAPILIEA